MDSPEIVTSTPELNESTDVFSDISNEMLIAVSETEMSEILSESPDFQSDDSVIEQSSEYVGEETLAAETLITDIPVSEGLESAGTIIETLPVETTVAETTVSMTETAVAVAQKNFDIRTFIGDNTNIITVFALAAAGAAVMAFLSKNKKKHSPEYEPKTAKERDKARLNEQAAIKKAKAKKEKEQSGGKKKLKISRTVADTIPYKKIFDNDIWLLADHTYSKVYAIDDINYNMGDGP